MDWNTKINLVSRKKSNVFDLIDDSRLYLNFLPDNNEKIIMDLGTGGGFPGIVIKIHRPEYTVWLVDSVKKKITAVNDIIEKLQLNKINTVWSRAEDLSTDNSFKNNFDFVVARSVAPLCDLLRWSCPLLKPSGQLLTLKGLNIEDEIFEAQNLTYVDAIQTHQFNNKQMISCIVKSD